MPISQYIGYCLLLVSALILLIITLYIFVASIFRQTIATLFVLLAILLLGYGLAAFVPWSPLAWINPLQYIIPQEMILNQNSQVWYQGLPAAIAAMVVFYVLSVYKVKTGKLE